MAVIQENAPVLESEKSFQNRLLVHWSKAGMRLFRNQVGTYELKDGRYLSSGLCDGSSDLIGWTPVIVTPEMVGKTVAVFTAIEVKKPFVRDRTNKIRKLQQARFLSVVREQGGLAVIASALDDVAVALANLIAGWS